MTIPDDLENRWWIEVSGANPGLVDDLRPALLAFVAFGPDRKPNIEGSGFIIAADKKAVVVITAKHVLYEGVFRTQRPMSRHAASSLFIQPSSITPSIDPKKMKVVWMGQDNAALLNAVHVSCNDTLDAACIICMPQESDADQFRPAELPINTTMPNVGEVVYMLSHDILKASETWRSSDSSANGRIISIEKRISIRVGVVTNIYPRGYRQFRWPCFTTSIPAEPGMSGGLVVLPVEGKTTSACGLVCADSSSEEARMSHLQCGESIVACMWPALTLCVPDSVPPTPTTQIHTLYHFMRSGRMPVAIGGIDHIDLVDLGNGAFRIGF